MMNRLFEPPTVAARLGLIAVDVVRRAGAPVDALFEGLALDERTLRTSPRLAWADYTALLTRAEEVLGGPAAAEAALLRHYDETIPEGRALRGFVSPMMLLRLIQEVINPLLFSHSTFEFEQLGPDRARCVGRLAPHLLPCPALFRLSTAAVRTVPKFLGLPLAEVHAEIRPREATWWVTLPPSQTAWAKLERHSRPVLRLLLGYLGVEPLYLRVGDEPEAPDRVALAGQRWGLSRRQLEVLEHVSRGASNKEIAAALHLSEKAVERHVSQLLERSGASSRAQLVARVWM